jgi:hypothetical protein
MRLVYMAVESRYVVGRPHWQWCGACLLCENVTSRRSPWAFICILLSLESWMQNADCVALFPMPLPRPGFFATSLTKMESCVPAAACPGVNSSAVSATFSKPVAAGALR